ncbi:unnamed protein product [Phyllotreta striolata]|uniref:Major facilitator superfamily associated domain-containing protein n=1 Tax=Phyllotreta striolata TaxID=444603 RepID=A0A9N9TJG6_PHYSR|nr:unnamed protein product [Phyllotreta striolata]
MGEEITAVDVEVNTDIPRRGFCGLNKNLVLLKVTLFFLHGATSSLVPYLTIHMQSIGLTMEQIAIIYLLLPFTTFIAPPITGILVDKFGRYKPVVIGCFLLTAILHHSLLLMPTREAPGIVPDGYIIRHPKKMYVEVWWSPCPSRQCPATEELDIVLDLCEDHCLLTQAKIEKRLQKNKAIDMNDPGDTDDLSFHIKKKKSNDTATAFTLDMHPNLGDPIEQFGIELESAEDDEDVTEFKKRFRTGMLRRHGVDMKELEHKDLRCGGIVLEANSSTQTRLSNYTNDCILQKCQFRFGGPEVCPPDFEESDPVIFWMYGILRFLATTLQLAAVSITDPVALSLIEKYGGDFGKERLFSCLGMAIFSPIVGALIDWNSERLGYTDYSAAFYAFDVLLIIASIAMFTMEIDTKLPSDSLYSDLKKILKMPALVVFVFFLFLLGNLWGFIESFLFFYLKDLGAPNYLLGITVTVGTLSSVPFLYGAEKITSKVGHVRVIIAAFFAHSIRLTGYSLTDTAWLCIPFEALEAIAVHFMWVAAATYCAVLAPKGLLATLLGVCMVAHYSVGRGSGSFFGGHLIAKFGITLTFRIMGAFAASSGLLYAFLHFVWLQKAERAVAEDSQEEEVESLRKGVKYRDQGTTMSMERLSVMAEFNPAGSLSSLGRSHLSRSSIIRRSSLRPHQKQEFIKSTNEIRRNSDKDISTHALYPSLSQAENGFIPNEKDEIVYDEIKRRNQSDDKNKKENENENLPTQSPEIESQK